MHGNAVFSLDYYTRHAAWCLIFPRTAKMDLQISWLFLPLSSSEHKANSLLRIAKT
jgi:hypothetical protein